MWSGKPSREGPGKKAACVSMCPWQCPRSAKRRRRQTATCRRRAAQSSRIPSITHTTMRGVVEGEVTRVKASTRNWLAGALADGAAEVVVAAKWFVMQKMDGMQRA